MPNSINIQIGAKNTASSEVQKIQKDFASLTTSAGWKSLIQGAEMGIGIAAFNAGIQAIKGLGDVFTESIAKAGEEQAVMERLRATLAANVPAWDGDTAAIEKRMAAGVQLGYMDSDTAAAMQILVGATHDVGKALDIESIAMDLARYKHEDLATASQSLVMVLAGQFRSLKSLGLAVKAGTDPMIALAEVEKVVAGQGEAFTNTYEGAQARLGATWDRLQEKLGNVLLPVLTDAEKGVADFLDSLGSLADHASDYSAAIGIITAGFIALAAATIELWAPFAAVAGLIAGVVAATTSLATAQKELSGANLEVAHYTDTTVNSFQSYEEQANRTAAAAGKLTNQQSIMVTSAHAAADALGNGIIPVLVQLSQEYFDTAAKSAKGYADGLRSRMTDVDAAMKNLEDVLKTSLTSTQQVSRLGGLLFGQSIAKGLQSAEPDVLAATYETVTAIVAQLDALKGPAYAEAVSAALYWNAGWRSTMLVGDTPSEARGTNMALQGLAATAKSTVAAFKPLASGSTFLPQITSAAKSAGAAMNTVKQQITDAFTRITASANAYFNAVHTKNLQAIDDARTLYDEQYQVQVDAINGQTQAQIDAINASVKAYSDQLQAKRDAEQQAQLESAVSTAATADDRATAEAALTTFLEDQHLKQLQTAADTQTKQLQTQSDAQVKALDVQKTAQDKQFDSAKTAEDNLYQMQVDHWKKASDALQAQLDKQGASYTTARAAILALLSDAKGDYLVAGTDLGTAIGDGVAAGVTASLTNIQQAMDLISKGAVSALTSAAQKAAAQSGNNALASLIAQGLGFGPGQAGGALQQAAVDAGTQVWTSPGVTAPRAAGGPIAPFGDYLVGENGPERLTMRGGTGYVTPSSGGRSSGQPVVINLTVDGRTLARVVDERLFYSYRTAARGGATP